MVFILDIHVVILYIHFDILNLFVASHFFYRRGLDEEMQHAPAS